MQSSPVTQDHFPKQLLVGVGVMLVLVLAVVAWARFETYQDHGEFQTGQFAGRSLHFEDRMDGGIAVIDATTHQEVARVLPETNGFLRSTLRGLARERKRRAIGSAQPFLLGNSAEGRLTLCDPATGRYVDLEAFGPSNSTVFRQFLATAPSANPSPGVSLAHR